MEQFEQPLRRPEKLLKKILLPDETVAEIYGNPETNKMEYFFCTDIKGNIIEFADISDDKEMRELVKKRYEDNGIALTENELNNLTPELIQTKWNKQINEIDENTATEQ